ncbi:MAG: hypothetical protein ACRETF_01495 [Nevskiaceae bacterium]
MSRKTYKYREVIKKLREHDKRFQEWRDRGKGSHRIIYHPSVNGVAASYPMVCHSEGADVHEAYLKGLVRRFNLPKDFF